MIRRLAVAAALALAAAADAWLHDSTTVLVALASVWTAQAIPAVIRAWRHR